MADILREAIGHIQEIVRSEFRLAKTEVQEQTDKAKRAGAMFGAGGVLALYGGGLLLAAIVCALALVVAAWAAALIVAAVCLIAAFGLFKGGRSRLQAVHGPEKTVQTVREDVQWAQSQRR